MGIFHASARSAYDYLVLGLGNPGLQYESTRHNAGFLALDRLCARCGAVLDRRRHHARIGEARVDSARLLLAAPETFMNLSGEAAAELLRFYKLPVERMIVLFDDISLDVGRLRVRRKGSDGGHNGIKNIIQITGSDAFPRVKIGVGAKPHPDYDLKDWVLGRFTDAQMQLLSPVLDDAAEAVLLLVREGVDAAMNRYNR